MPGQGTFHEAGVGALAVDQEELAAVAGGAEPLAFDVGGLTGARGADDQPDRSASAGARPGRAVGPAEITVDLEAQGDGAEVVVAHGGGALDGAVHAALGLMLGALDLGRVDGLPPAGQVERGHQQPTGTASGSWGHRNAPGAG